jgi:hypothetical protein
MLKFKARKDTEKGYKTDPDRMIRRGFSIHPEYGHKDQDQGDPDG